MGVQITELLAGEEIALDRLKGKILAVDAHLFLYQFLTTIRQPDGTPLSDSKGNVTSHLIGLFTRSTSLMRHGIKLAYVFDGKPPKLKEKEREKRKEIKIEAGKKYKEAVEKEDTEGMRKYAARTSRLTSDMIEESKKLIEALGLPVVQAPSEGEAQAAFIVKNHGAFAVASQDADSLLFGAPRLIRNLSMAGRRKRTNKLAYETIKPQLISLSDTLNTLKIDQGQLIALAMLVGTDFNPGGIKGIGPKNALKLVTKHGNDFDALFREVKWDGQNEVPWTEIFYLIQKMPATEDYHLGWKSPHQENIIKLLVDEHDFSLERVQSTLEKFKEETSSRQQKGLGEFF